MATLMVAPVVAGQGWSEQVQDLKFAAVTFTVGPDSLKVWAEDVRFTGQAASDIRKCIDGKDCPIQQFGQFFGNRDGSVSQDEVNDISELAPAALSSIPEFRAIRDELKALVSIDGLPASTMHFAEVRIEGATGPASSTAPIDISVGLEALYSSTGQQGPHTIVFKRAEANLTLTERIIVRAANGWQMDKDSISPSSLQALWVKDHLEGSQKDFEGTTPLQFEIKEKSSNTALWVGAGAVGAAAAGAAGFFVYKRRKV
jgi:hypothetical protein